MRKWAAIFVLVLHVMATTECSELLKLPVLVQHFMEHRSEEGDVSFVNFMKMHYAKEEHHHEPNHNHQLPFKSHEGCINLNILICLIQPLPVSGNNLFPHSPYYFIAPEETFQASAHLSAIWQPPKNC